MACFCAEIAYLRFLEVHDLVVEDVLDNGGLHLSVVHAHGLLLPVSRLLLLLLLECTHSSS